MTRPKRRLTLVLVLAFGLSVVAWLSDSQLSLAGLVQQEQSLRDAISAHPISCWFIGFVAYLAASLIPGTRGKAVLFGWMFGFWPALFLVNVALTLAALLTFFASRYLLRDAIESRYGSRLAWINQALEREGAWYVIVLRVVPISFSLTNYLLGATSIRPRTYWWATQVGLLPANAVFVFVGSQLPSLAELVHMPLTTLISWQVILGLVVLSAFPFLVQKLVSRWRSRLPVLLLQSPRVIDGRNIGRPFGQDQ